MEGEELRRLLGKAPADGDLTHVSGNGSSDPDDDVSGAGSDAAT